MISALFWNIRGIVNTSSISRLKKIIQVYHASFVAIVEPMVDPDRITHVRLQLGFDYALSNNCSSIWIFWNSTLNCNVLCNTPQCISLLCTHGMVDKPFVISAVYGKCSKVERRDLWQCLENIALNSKAWIIGGDFNIVRTASERLRGNNIDFSVAQEFNDFIFKCGLAG